MAGYKEIKGFQVQTRSEDPTPYAQALADNPYAGAWGSGGSLNQARSLLSSAGIQTAALAFGGDGSPVPAAGTDTESYDGSSWTELATVNTSRYGAVGVGLYTAAIMAGGANDPSTVSNLDVVESWNGSSWTEVADMNTARSFHGGAGISTSALSIGGYILPWDSPSKTANVESWNGSAWTEKNNLNTARGATTGFGASYTAALCTGGTASPGPRTANTETWDGTTWTETSKLISGTPYGGGGHGAAASGRVGVGTLAGGAHKFGGGVFSTPASELFSAVSYTHLTLPTKA